MKTITLFIIALSVSLMSFGQNQSMTIAHTGLSPNAEITVIAGDSIDFFFGSGGTHPMTEGWQSGESSTPISFATQTVSNTIQSTTFAMDTPGTYYFHCGTNPSNAANWGKIIVLDAAAAGTPENQLISYTVYPNPATDILTIEGVNQTVEIYNLIGEKVLEVNSSTINISTLPNGEYVIKIGEFSSTFVKI